MKISIFGMGYVGCVALGCLAESGHKTIGVDINEEKVDLINNGKATISEKDIDDIIKNNSENIEATTNSLKAVKNTDVALICVGTPNDKNGHLDMQYVEKVSEEIAKGIKEKDKFYTVAIRSTVMPGTNKKVSELIENISGKKKNKDFGVVSNPEFLREGSAVEDFYNPPYTVVATESDKAIANMKELYSKVNGEFIRSDIGSAELIKFVNNSFHALKVTFANEIGRISKELDIDSNELMDLFQKDEQLNISSSYLNPGFAYGGSCLPKDLKALNTIGHDKYLDLPVLSSVRDSNRDHIDYAYHLITEENKDEIGFYNISFKPGTDDLRFSPGLELVERLLGKGYKVRVYDRHVNIAKLMGKNKEYLYNKLPHINEILLDDISELKSYSDLIVVTKSGKKVKELEDYNGKIIDLTGINDLADKENYEGLCW